MRPLASRSERSLLAAALLAALVSLSASPAAATTCGDSVVEGAEQCDDGNMNNGDCCSSTCFFESAATVCRASAGTCDVEETCTGSSGTCPADGFESTATECRSSTGVCDPAETCTGVDASCPTDDLLDGVPCLDGDVCNGAEECVVGVCQPMAPLSCDDADACTADSCDEVTGCANDPIAECTVPAVPASSEWSLLLIVLLMTAVGGASIKHTRRRSSI